MAGRHAGWIDVTLSGMTGIWPDVCPARCLTGPLYGCMYSLKSVLRAVQQRWWRGVSRLYVSGSGAAAAQVAAGDPEHGDDGDGPEDGVHDQAEGGGDRDDDDCDQNVGQHCAGLPGWRCGYAGAGEKGAGFAVGSGRLIRVSLTATGNVVGAG